MPETIYYICPDCQNDEFEIVKVLVHPKAFADKKKKELVHLSGYYRCECTSCGLPQTIKSKSPMSYEDDAYGILDGIKIFKNKSNSNNY